MTDSLFQSTECDGTPCSPTSRRAHAIDVVAGISSDILQVHLTFTRAWHRRPTIESLAIRYIQALRRIIEHCLSPQAGGFSPLYDFPFANLDQNEIDVLVETHPPLEDILYLLGHRCRTGDVVPCF